SSQLQQGKDLNLIAQEFAQPINKTGLCAQDEPLPILPEVKRLTQVLSQLKEGQLSQIVYAEDAAYIFLLREKKESYLPLLSEIKDKLKEKIIQTKTKELAQTKINAALNAIKGGLDFARAAKEAGLIFKSTPYFGIKDKVEDMPEAGLLFNYAFKLDKDKVSDLVTTPEGLYIVRLKDRQPIDEEKFAKEKEEFTKTLMLLEREYVFNTLFQKLKAQANLKDNTQNLKIQP
ncbi:MAG: peptidyl-prolyl cis-trans isomerase, partial [Candidatus Omnitrophica bacterium]|nr:peptidyl-prolyl cis-trans isomerase [Candidatus Omnitrophota bacterium]